MNESRFERIHTLALVISSLSATLERVSPLMRVDIEDTIGNVLVVIDKLAAEEEHDE